MAEGRGSAPAPAPAPVWLPLPPSPSRAGDDQEGSRPRCLTVMAKVEAAAGTRRRGRAHRRTGTPELRRPALLPLRDKSEKDTGLRRPPGRQAGWLVRWPRREGAAHGAGVRVMAEAARTDRVTMRSSPCDAELASGFCVRSGLATLGTYITCTSACWARRASRAIGCAGGLISSFPQ